MDHLSTVRELSTELRGIFERILADAIGTNQTAGACLHAAILLSTILTKFANAPSHVCGGGPPLDGGLRDKEGVLRGHYWVEGRCPTGEPFVADITADQFGYAKVVVLDSAVAAELYYPGNPEIIAEHVAEERASWPEDARAVGAAEHPV